LHRKVTRDNILPEELFDKAMCFTTCESILAYNLQDKAYQDSTEDPSTFNIKTKNVGTNVAQSFYFHATVTAM
jgi:hypothetical protein